MKPNNNDHTGLNTATTPGTSTAMDTKDLQISHHSENLPSKDHIENDFVELVRQDSNSLFCGFDTRGGSFTLLMIGGDIGHEKILNLSPNDLFIIGDKLQTMSAMFNKSLQTTLDIREKAIEASAFVIPQPKNPTTET